MSKRRSLSAGAVLAHVAVIAIAAFAISRTLEVASTDGLNFLIWLVAGAILHDIVLLPAYSLVDLLSRLAMSDHPLRRVRAANHVRFPAAISLVVLLVYSPTILDRNPGTFERLSGRPQATDPLEAWLWITLGLFVVSGAALAARSMVDRRRRAEHSELEA
jgi:hypothetical protein